MRLVKIFFLAYLTSGLIICTQFKIGKATAFQGAPIATCSDNIDATDPFRVMNSVEADTSKPEYLMLKFISAQGQYPFNGIVTVKWHNLSNSREGTFQLQRINNHYNIAAVHTGPGLVALAIIFSNSLILSEPRTLPAAQCNAQVDVINTPSEEENADLNPPTSAPNDTQPNASMAPHNASPDHNTAVSK